MILTITITLYVYRLTLEDKVLSIFISHDHEQNAQVSYIGIRHRASSLGFCFNEYFSNSIGEENSDLRKRGG